MSQPRDFYDDPADHYDDWTPDDDEALDIEERLDRGEYDDVIYPTEEPDGIPTT